MYDVRWRVFVDEQAVPPDMERDADDETADHAVALVDAHPVGAGRLVARADGVGVVGRLAVLAGARGTGIGGRLLALLEERAQARGLSAVELHAQTHARAFYERAGYTAYGEEYDEAGIPHVSMRKPLTGDRAG